MLDLIAADIVGKLVQKVVFHNQYEEKGNDLRNRFAEGGYSKVGTEIWSEQSIHWGFESAVNVVAK
jgi:hypothetical protein